MPGAKLTRDDLRKAAEKYKNWGKWGPDDEIGTLLRIDAAEDADTQFSANARRLPPRNTR